MTKHESATSIRQHLGSVDADFVTWFDTLLGMQQINAITPGFAEAIFDTDNISKIERFLAHVSHPHFDILNKAYIVILDEDDREDFQISVSEYLQAYAKGFLEDPETGRKIRDWKERTCWIYSESDLLKKLRSEDLKTIDGVRHVAKFLFRASVILLQDEGNKPFEFSFIADHMSEAESIVGAISQKVEWIRFEGHFLSADALERIRSSFSS